VNVLLIVIVTIMTGDRSLKPGEWKCKSCNFVNWSVRINCNKCQKPAPKDQLKKKDSRVGVDAAIQSKGLFSPDDWICFGCGYVNWEKRTRCNSCKKRKPNIETKCAFPKGTPQGEALVITKEVMLSCYGAHKLLRFSIMPDTSHLECMEIGFWDLWKEDVELQNKIPVDCRIKFQLLSEDYDSYTTATKESIIDDDSEVAVVLDPKSGAEKIKSVNQLARELTYEEKKKREELIKFNEERKKYTAALRDELKVEINRWKRQREEKSMDASSRLRDELLSAINKRTANGEATQAKRARPDTGTYYVGEDARRAMNSRY